MKSIGVFFGSRSPEHDISIITAQLIISGLKGLGYPIVPVYINKQGEWLIGDDLSELEVFTDDSNILKSEQLKNYSLDLNRSRGKFVFTTGSIFKKSLEIDIAFPAFHGSFGEDGTFQGLCELFDVPYVGSGVAASAIAMDKALTKKICQANGIPTPKFTVFKKEVWQKDPSQIIERIIKELLPPYFVKPVHLGSSIGISKVKKADKKELEEKIEVALYYDDKVLVEEGVENLMDITCSVLGNDQLLASLLQESLFSADLFDFEEKYLKKGGAQLGKAESGIIIPARLPKETAEKIQDAAKAVFVALGCSGLSRVDFLFNKKTGQFFVNEVNPLPGTLYHHLWKESGLSLEELLERLIKLAEEKQTQERSLTRVFNSSVLKSLNSKKLQKGSF